jgi:hypothetical protein
MTGPDARAKRSRLPDQPETVKVAVVQPSDMTMLSLYDSPQGQGDDGWNRPTYRGGWQMITKPTYSTDLQDLHGLTL